MTAPSPSSVREQMRNFTSWTHGPLTHVILDSPQQYQAMDHLTDLPYVCGKDPCLCLRQTSSHPTSPVEEKTKQNNNKTEQRENLQKIEGKTQNISQTSLDKVNN